MLLYIVRGDNVDDRASDCIVRFARGGEQADFDVTQAAVSRVLHADGAMTTASRSGRVRDGRLDGVAQCAGAAASAASGA